MMSDDDGESCSMDEDTIDSAQTLSETEKRFVDNQYSTQRKRRKVSGGRGYSSKTSTLSTLAAKFIQDGGQFKFRLCWSNEPKLVYC